MTVIENSEAKIDNRHSQTARLAEFAANLTFEAIPSDVIAHIKVCMLDTLGCALFGSTLPWGKIIIDFVKDASRTGNRVAVEMSRESAIRLVESINTALTTGEAAHEVAVATA